jgi:predicted transcriptional regulator
VSSAPPDAVAFAEEVLADAVVPLQFERASRYTVLRHMATLTIRLPAQLRRELERLSRQRQRAAGDIVRESLRRYLAVERFRELRAKALPFAEAQGFLTDEDVFKAVS